MQNNGASQFKMFDALSGFTDMLKNEDRVLKEKLEFFDDYQEIINFKLQEVKQGDLIKIEYYEDGEFILLIDNLIKIDKFSKTIYFSKTKVLINNIISIEIID